MRTFKLLALLLFGISTLQGFSQSREAFIRKYKHLAIKEMERTGIPASIKLAQGILESGCGISELSVNANNHFGIKCHNWVGATYHMDDDKPEECFRKYKSPEQSWIDHSEFLLSRPRYASLFKIPATDYKAWARGLKAAGYATNPQYAEKLIRIIEEEHLYRYDRKVKHPTVAPHELAQTPAVNRPDAAQAVASANYRKREEMVNGILCIRVKTGDSLENIANYYGIKLKKLLAYNDKNDYNLIPGQLVFLKKKKNKAARGYEFHRVKAGDNLYLISQMYGVKLKSLIKFNYIQNNTPLLEGEKIYLRSRAGM